MTAVVVVGGGASGVLAAVALARRPVVSRVTVVERSGRVGPGLAYGAADAHHLLNSPAGKMSAIPGDDGHFVTWCAEHGDPVPADAFVPRRRYGDYLAHVFDAVVAEHGRVESIRGEAVAIEPGGSVRLADGRTVQADHIVLALGNPPPTGRGSGADILAVADPWAPGALDPIDGGRVLLLGTGLTMVDVATRLARRDDRVELTATSRGLLLPRVHLEAPVPPGPGLRPLGSSLGALLTAFGERLKAARAEGRPWQAEVDGVRPQVNDLWHGLPPTDRLRFVERVSRRWEVHRHRMAPSVAAELGALRDSEQLTIGAVDDLRAFDTVVDCTGPRPTSSRGWSRLVDDLLAHGRARPDPLGVGLDIALDGALLDAGGRPSQVVSVLGPARRGVQWESTAVPEIRAHAVALASAIAA